MRFSALALCVAVPLAAGVVVQPVPAFAAGGSDAMIADAGIDDAQYPARRPPVRSLRDPLSSAWSVSITRLDADRLRIELRMRRLVTGGEGEARQIFVRNVRRLAEEGGYAAYDILSFDEGIESGWPFAQRVATGEVRLVHARSFSY